jgi:hypothetical protein
LKREEDVWVRPDEGYVDVARLSRASDGAPELLEIRGGHLRDYLAARELALCVTSYRQRVEVRASGDGISWAESPATDSDDTDSWEGRIIEICEGGRPYGESAAIMHVKRTDVDPQEDVPQFDFPTDDVIESRTWTRKYEGKKLYRIEGELWRAEWVDPADASPIVRGDKPEPTVFFITDAEGKTESRKTLIHGSRWLWFRPEVMMSLAHRRGGSLSWYTRDTGSVRCSPSYGIHFGVNSLGLINVYAKDIGLLPDWQQKIWAGYNVSPDGKVSEELLASQMRAEPADTQAPEKFLSIGLRQIVDLSTAKLGVSIIRDHDVVPEVLSKTHRFRATDKAGLYSLAKDLARLTADSLDAAAIQTIVTPPKREKWGSLKSLEHLIALQQEPHVAHEIMGSLVGAYELRHGDAHLPSKEVDQALELAGVDQALPFVLQGYQMLHACVSSIFSIIEVLKQWNEVSSA